MNEKELKDRIGRGYLIMGYAVFALVIGVFAFLFQNTYTGNVGLSIDLNGRAADKNIVIFAGLFVGMLYLTYHYLFRENRK